MTPMMKQYHAMKRQCEGAILLFHLGDFYEAFYEDAVTCSEVLGITLTSRSKDGDRIPMAGIPIRAAQGYIEGLLRAGYKVALCDQVEDPSKAKGIVRREITRILTPGTVTEGAFLEDKSNNFLLSVVVHGNTVGLAWMDTSTGEFYVNECKLEHLPAETARIEPSEVLIPQSTPEEVKATLAAVGAMITIQEDTCFTPRRAMETLLSHFGVTSLDGFGCAGMETAIRAAGAALAYANETQKETLPHISSIRPFIDGETMHMDHNTRKNLDLVRNGSTGERRYSLVWAIDRTMTPMGARTLQKWITAPLCILPEIERRHEAVKRLMEPSLRTNLRETLHGIGDLERLCGKVARRRLDARGMIALRDALRRLPRVRAELESEEGGLLEKIRESITPLEKVEKLISSTLVDDPPQDITGGGIIREGVNEELDKLRELAANGKGHIKRMEEKERERTGIPSLKIRFNNVFGYYIEVTNTHKEKVPPDYVRKQTLKNAERFFTKELKELETTLLNAEEKAHKIEYEIFCNLRDRVAEHVGSLQSTARAIGELDTLLSFAQTAVEEDFCRPRMTEEAVLRVKDGFHPVVKKVLESGEFMPNDTILEANRNFMVITGPNMSGKSTYIRQVALICILAQAGSFVPASSAEIGIVDRLFTRIGASDELARGQSTFMVEMNETAFILNNATERSLIILDEVGRGTSTLDGLSIAWAVAEDIHDRIRARTLFATHFHELTALAEILDRVVNYNVLVREWGEEVVFLHKIEPGASDRSYGIHVARLAGIPEHVVKRAREMLERLSDNTLRLDEVIKNERSTKQNSPRQPTLFDLSYSEIEEEIRNLNLDTITPLEALLLLKKFQEKIG